MNSPNRLPDVTASPRLAPRSREWRRGLCTVAVAIGGALLAAGAEPTLTQPEDDDVVSLPPLWVETQVAQLNWRYLATRNVEVLSVCDDDVTRAFVRRCLQLDDVLALLLPERFQRKIVVPRIQILFNEELHRARSAEVVMEMLRRDGHKAPSPGAPVTLPFVPRSGDTLTPWNRRRVQFLPNLHLTDVDAEAVFAATHASDATQLQFTFVSDRIEYLLERRVPALPDWFVEGMLGLYEHCRLNTEGIAFEPLVWLSTAQTRGLLADADFPRTLLPMHELLADRRAAPKENEDHLVKIWRAQCALFVRWALLEEGGARKAALRTLVDRLDHEPMTEALFRECLGLGYADVRDILSDALPEALRGRAFWPAPRRTTGPELRPRAATTSEIARLRGDWERMEVAYVAGRWPELTEKYVEQARRTLDHAYAQGVRDPQLLAIIGLMECDAGNHAGARAYLEAAGRAQVPRPRVYVELARLRFDEETKAVGEGKLNARQVARILEPLNALGDMQPRLPVAYGLMADTWTRSEDGPTAEELMTLTEGVRDFPRIPPLIYRGIYLNAANGRVDAAVSLAELGLRHASRPEERDRLQRVLTQLALARRQK